jgi:hypothetical protein
VNLEFQKAITEILSMNLLIAAMKNAVCTTAGLHSPSSFAISLRGSRMGVALANLVRS